MLIRCQKEEKEVCEKGLSYGEAALLLTDECDNKFRIPLSTEPDPEALAKSISDLSQQLVILFTRKFAVTTQDIINTNILCPYSAVTIVNSFVSTTGVFVFEAATDALIRALNAYKDIPFNGNQVSVSSRLVSNDVLLLNVVITLFDPSGTVPLGGITLSGYYHIINCGSKLCIDTLNVSVTSPA